jgi:hypothetical protein
VSLAIWRGLRTEVGMEQPLLDVQQLTKHYSLRARALHRLLPQRQTPVLRAVDGVSFTGSSQGAQLEVYTLPSLLDAIQQR